MNSTCLQIKMREEKRRTPTKAREVMERWCGSGYSKFNTKKKEIHAMYPDLPYTLDGGDKEDLPQ